VNQPAGKETAGEIPDGKSEHVRNLYKTKQQKPRQRNLNHMKQPHPVPRFPYSKVDIGKDGPHEKKMKTACRKRNNGSDSKGGRHVSPELHFVNPLLYSFQKKEIITIL